MKRPSSQFQRPLCHAQARAGAQHFHAQARSGAPSYDFDAAHTYQTLGQVPPPQEGVKYFGPSTGYSKYFRGLWYKYFIANKYISKAPKSKYMHSRATIHPLALRE